MCYGLGAQKLNNVKFPMLDSKLLSKFLINKIYSIRFFLYVRARVCASKTMPT